MQYGLAEGARMDQHRHVTSQQAQNGPIDEPKTPADVKQEPYSLPSRYTLSGWLAHACLTEWAMHKLNTW
jgi:hypothetical protein